MCSIVGGSVIAQRQRHNALYFTLTTDYHRSCQSQAESPKAVSQITIVSQWIVLTRKPYALIPVTENSLCYQNAVIEKGVTFLKLLSFCEGMAPIPLREFQIFIVT
jgi:hypothetical protein